MLAAVVCLATAALSSCAENRPPKAAVVGTGFDDLTPRERRDVERLARDLPAPCPGTSMSLDECLRGPAGCSACKPGSRLLAKQVRDGRSIEQAAAAYNARFGAEAPKPIDTSEAPSLGPANAPVTVVEYADFQCPFCSTTVAMLDALVKDNAPNVRVVFKHYPLPSHTSAEDASRAAVAAGKQGRFWEMHHKLFENQRALLREDIEHYARELRLDLDRFKADWGAPETAARVKADYTEGTRIGVNGTPTIFINGRRFDTKLFDMSTDLPMWIEAEIEIAGGAAASQPPPSQATQSAPTVAPVAPVPPSSSGSLVPVAPAPASSAKGF